MRSTQGWFVCVVNCCAVHLLWQNKVNDIKTIILSTKWAVVENAWGLHADKNSLYRCDHKGTVLYGTVQSLSLYSISIMYSWCDQLRLTPSFAWQMAVVTVYYKSSLIKGSKPGSHSVPAMSCQEHELMRRQYNNLLRLHQVRGAIQGQAIPNQEESDAFGFLLS